MNTLLHKSLKLLEANNPKSALLNIEQFINENGISYEPLLLKCKILSELARYSESIELYKYCIKEYPQRYEVYFYFAATLHKLGYNNEALNHYLTTIDLNPTFFDGYIAIAKLYESKRRYKKAIEYLNRAAPLANTDTQKCDIYILLALNFLNIEHFDSARVHAIEAAKFNQISAYLALALTLEYSGERTEALNIYNDLINNIGFDENIFLNLADFFARENQFDNAINILESFRSQHPLNQRVLIRLSSYYGLIVDRISQQAIFDVLRTITDERQLLINIGMNHLKNREFQNGLSLFALSAEPNPFFDCNLPLWNGENIDGKSLLIVSVLGFGDNLNFARFLQHRALENIKITFLCQDELLTLFKSSTLPVEFVSLADFDNSYLSLYDYQVSIFRLASVLDIEYNDITNYLYTFNIDKNSTKNLTKTIKNSKPNIALAWEASETRYGSSYGRSLPLSYFIPFKDNFNLFSLQKDFDSDELEEFQEKTARALDVSYELDSFMDTATLMQNMDAIITTDKVIVHLAGLLGKKCYLLLHYDADWKWETTGDTTPWYPSVTIIRQTIYDNWHSCTDQLY